MFTGSTIDVKGIGLVADEMNMGFSAGSISSLIMRNPEGAKLVTVEGKFDAAELTDAAHMGFYAFMEAMFAGKDDFTGSNLDDALYGFGGKDKIDGGAGVDIIDGGAGDKDRLTGGKDDDFFIFKVGDGHDVVKDFDAKGSSEHLGHDTVWLYSSDFKVSKNADGDAVIVLGADDTLTLEGVSKNQLKDYDIQVLEM
jgi:hypothetical protein